MRVANRRAPSLGNGMDSAGRATPGWEQPSSSSARRLRPWRTMRPRAAAAATPTAWCVREGCTRRVWGRGWACRAVCSSSQAHTVAPHTPFAVRHFAVCAAGHTGRGRHRGQRHGAATRVVCVLHNLHNLHNLLLAAGSHVLRTPVARRARRPLHVRAHHRRRQGAVVWVAWGGGVWLWQSPSCPAAWRPPAAPSAWRLSRPRPCASGVQAGRAGARRRRCAEPGTRPRHTGRPARCVRVVAAGCAAHARVPRAVVGCAAPGCAAASCGAPPRSLSPPPPLLGLLHVFLVARVVVPVRAFVLSAARRSRPASHSPSPPVLSRTDLWLRCRALCSARRHVRRPHGSAGRSMKAGRAPGISISKRRRRHTGTCTPASRCTGTGTD